MTQKTVTEVKADFEDEKYYDLWGPGATYYGATKGGAARIHYNPRCLIFGASGLCIGPRT